MLSVLSLLRVYQAIFSNLKDILYWNGRNPKINGSFQEGLV